MTCRPSSATSPSSTAGRRSTPGSRGLHGALRAPELSPRRSRSGEDKIRALFQHGKDPQIGDKPLGPIRELREEEEGPYYEVPLLDTAYNRELIPGLEAGLYGASFRFEVLRVDEDLAPERSSTTRRRCPSTVKEAPALRVRAGHVPHACPTRQACASRYLEFLFEQIAREPREGHELLALAIDLSPQGTTHPPTPTPGLPPRNKRAAQAATTWNERKSLHGSSDEEELIAKRDQLESEIKEFGETLAESGERMDQDQKDNWNRLNTELDEITANLKERDAVEKRIRDLNEEGKTETGASFNVGTARTKNIYDLSSVERSFSDPSVEGQELKDRAKRALDSAYLPHPDADQASKHVERLVQKLDGEDGAFSRYLVATDNPPTSGRSRSCSPRWTGDALPRGAVRSRPGAGCPARRVTNGRLGWFRSSVHARPDHHPDLQPGGQPVPRNLADREHRHGQLERRLLGRRHGLVGRGRR